MHERINALGNKYQLTALDEGKTLIEFDSKSIIVDEPWERINQGWYNWSMKGMHIQEAFPFLSPAEREFILTGITEREWALLFGEGEEDR